VVVLTDEAGGTDVGGGGLPEQQDAYIYLGGEPTVHAFTPEHVEQATRFQYQAAQSGVVYSVLASGEALKSPALIATVAGQMAHAWNQNALVPGVTDIAETQEVRPLGSLEDVYQIAVESTNGKTGGVLTVEGQNIRPDVFAELVADYRATLDAFG
jgi:hypothetical protein